MVAEPVVREHLAERTVERDARLDIESRLQVHGVDGRGAAVDEPVAPPNRRRVFVGVEFDAQICRRPLGLWDVLVVPVAPLVSSAALHLFIPGDELVEHVRVVEDEAAEGEDEGHGDGGDAGRRARETLPRNVQPRP